MERTVWQKFGDVIDPIGRSLNQEVVKAALPWHYKHYSKDKILLDLESLYKKHDLVSGRTLVLLHGGKIGERVGKLCWKNVQDREEGDL